MYEFIDTIETSDGANILPSEALKINGIYIENEIKGYRTLKVEGRELLESEISDIQIGNSNGSRYRSKRNPSRAITVTYRLETHSAKEFRVKFNRLNYLLDQEELKLIFLDEPDKYFIGTKSVVDEVEPGLLSVVSQFTFYCADPYKYSTYTVEATNSGESTITLINNGTKPTPVSVKATMKSDNGYVGFTLDDRFYQVGKPEEVDGETYEETVLLFDDHMTVDRGWLLNQGVTPPVTNERLQVGTVQYVTEKAGEGTAGEGYVEPVTYGSGNSWHGPSVTKIVPADANGAYPTNWLAVWRFDFNTDGVAFNPGEQIGHNSVTFSDQNGNVICSVVFEDNHASLQRSDMVIYVGSTRVWDTKNTTDFYITGAEGRDGGTTVNVEKIGDQVNIKFNYKGINKTFFVADTSAQLRKVTWYGAAYKTYDPLQNNLLRALQVRKHNVERYEDIPNYFMSGDTVELDSIENELYINNMLDWDMVDIGSKPLLLPPGVHTLGIVKSDWAEMPDVEVNWRERWM